MRSAFTPLYFPDSASTNNSGTLVEKLPVFLEMKISPKGASTNNVEVCLGLLSREIVPAKVNCNPPVSAAPAVMS